MRSSVLFSPSLDANPHSVRIFLHVLSRNTICTKFRTENYSALGPCSSLPEDRESFNCLRVDFLAGRKLSHIFYPAPHFRSECVSQHYRCDTSSVHLPVYLSARECVNRSSHSLLDLTGTDRASAQRELVWWNSVDRRLLWTTYHSYDDRQCHEALCSFGKS